MAGRRFQWLGSLDLGAFAVAANWDDLTDAINPSTLTPGSADTIELASTAGVMNGSGTVADIWLTSGAATVLADLVTSTLTLSTGAGLILGGSLAVGSQLAGSSGTISLAGGTLTFGANVTGSTGGLVGNGVIGFGTADVLSFATLNAANALALATGDRITATTLTLSAGGAIAAGATLSALIGTIDGLSDAGTLIVQGSTAAIDEVMELGTLSGGGVVNIAADGIFELAGPSSNGIVFATNANALVNVRGALEGFASILQIDQPTAYTGTISGFGANDEIDLQGIHANSATLTNGTLDVFNGATLVDTLLLAGSYANQVFAVNPDYGDGSFIIDSGAAQFAYAISSFSDLVGEGSTIDNEVKNDVSAALANWSAYVAGWGTLSVAVYIENTSSSQIIAEAGPTAEIAMYEEFGGLQLPASTYLLRTGVNPTGAVAQIAVTIDAYQLGNLFLPTTGTPAANQYDAVSILTHELGHGLGIIGNATGSTMPSSPSTFDSWINFTTDSFYGPDAMAAMAGAPVPLATSIGTGSNWYHPAPSVKNPNTGGPDLMGPYGIQGTITTISALDLGFIQDAGAPVVATVGGYNAQPSATANSLVMTDFLGTGVSSLLWSGAAGVQLSAMNGLTEASTMLVANPGTFWHAMAGGDFTGSGTTDLALQADDGSVAVWLLNGGSIGSGAVLANPGTFWQVAGAGDFDGDGQAEILLQGDDGSVATWDVNGTTLAGSAIVANPGTFWHVVGTGDFNSDGYTDIVLQSDEGSVAEWQMARGTLFSSAIIADPGSAWHVRATGDLNADGHTDLVLQSDEGSVAVWAMNGATISQSVIIADPGSAWRVIGCADVMGDGRDDILLQNSNGAAAVWEMNGTTLAASALVPTPGISQALVGPGAVNFIAATAPGTLAATMLDDEFQFTAWQSGTYTLQGFDPLRDSIALPAASFASFAAVQAASAAGSGGLAIALGGGASIVLPGVASLLARDVVLT